MAKGCASCERGGDTAERAPENLVGKATFALVVTALALGACSNEPVAARPATPTMGATSTTSASTIAAESVSAATVVAGDPDGVPDFAPATACFAAAGDARATRTLLRALERSHEPVPPDAVTLLEGCRATAHDIAEALEKAGRAIGRAREHDHEAAAAYYRRAIEVDPSYAPARLSLAGARSQLGNVDGALYQLDQIRNSGPANRRVVSRVYFEGSLAALRLQPRFWTWAGNPVSEMVATLPAATEEPLGSLGSALSFTPAPEIEPEVIYAHFGISGTHYRTIPPAVNAAAGTRITRATSVVRTKMLSPWLDHLDSIGATLLTRPSVFRFGGDEVVVAIPFMFGETDMEQFAVVLAKGPESGPFEIVRVVAPSAECDTPAAFTSRDRRVVGFFTSCDEGEDPTGFGRCIVFEGSDGIPTLRCGNGAGSTLVGAGHGTDEDYGEEEESFEDYGD